MVYTPWSIYQGEFITGFRWRGHGFNFRNFWNVPIVDNRHVFNHNLGEIGPLGTGSQVWTLYLSLFGIPQFKHTRFLGPQGLGGLNPRGYFNHATFREHE